MSTAAPRARAVELSEVGRLVGLRGAVRFVRRIVEADSDTVAVVVGEVDQEGRWSAAREVLCTTSQDVTRLRSAGGVAVDVEHLPPPAGLVGGHGAGQLDLTYLQEHAERLAAAAAAAEAAGLPSHQLNGEVAAWSRTTVTPAVEPMLRAVEAMARLDGSLAWRLASDLLADAQLDRFGPRLALLARGAVSAAPTTGGRVHRRGQDTVVSGTWRHVPGALDNQWLLLPVTGHGPDSCAVAELLLIAAADVVIEASCLRSGLRGSGDHQVVLRECSVSAEQVVTDVDTPHEPTTATTASVLRSALMAAACSGLASAVVQGVTDLARSKIRSGTSEPLITDPTVAKDLSRAAVELPALWAALLARAASVDAGGAEHPRAAAWLTVTARTVAERAVTHADNAFRPVGASALASTSPMQRALRDLMAVARHITPPDDASRAAVGAVLGADVPPIPGEDR